MNDITEEQQVVPGSISMLCYTKDEAMRNPKLGFILSRGTTTFEWQSIMFLLALGFDCSWKFRSKKAQQDVSLEVDWKPIDKNGYIRNHKKTIKNGQARTRESEEYKKKPKNQSRSQKSQI
ncbi:hypothetical protein Tco_0049206 [Tanacetum coccineum]